MMIKSISYDQQEILQDILKLHCDRITADCCYSKGVFYKNGKVPEPLLKFDINPQTEDTIKCDCRNLPLINESIESLIFDPPFLATKGKSLKDESSNNIIAKRFGVYSNEQELLKFYEDSIKEFKRVLKPNGILIFKCQDKVSSGKQYFTHCDIFNMCRENGFVAVDLFVLLAKSRLVADWQLKNQKHARKFHCYFWVFKKEKPNEL